MNQDLLNLLKQRRSIYALGKDVKQNPDDLVDLIETVIQEHDKLWDIVVKRLESEVPTEQAYEATKQKIASFKAAYGTIMYFTDTDVVKQLENNFPLYAANFATWAEQAQGSAQLNTWVTLANNGIGANLQHYNPIIDDLVREAFDIPTNWNLRAQMPFGSIEGSAKDKDYMDRKDQFKVLK